MNSLDEIFKANRDPKKYSKAYIDFLIGFLNSLDHETIAQIVGLFEKTQQNQGRIYFAGNGGSASTCGHFVNDFHVDGIIFGNENLKIRIQAAR